MDALNPRTFELAVAADGVAGPGIGIVASFVPATGGEPPVVALAHRPPGLWHLRVFTAVRWSDVSEPTKMGL